MGLLWGLLGLIVLGYGLLDLLWTTFLEGGAPLTSRVCNLLARTMMATLPCERSRRPISVTGLLAVLSTVTIWTLLIWSGWSLIFSASPHAVVFAQTGQPAATWDRIYFAGSNIFTLGTGDLRPEGRFWMIMTALAAGNGFLIIGTALAYLVPVISAATQKRQVAVCITSLGNSPSDIIIRAWNGADASALGPHLISLTAMLALLGENHLTYPVLHYFYSTKRSSAVGPSVAALDEAVTVLECGLQKGCSLDLPSLGAVRQAITEFLETLKPALIFAASDAPPSPSLASLREVGIPVVDDTLFESAVAALADRRKLLLSLIRHEGWHWDAVWPPVPGSTPTPSQAPFTR